VVERACYRGLRQSPIYELQPSGSGPLLELRETAVLSGAPATHQPDAHPVAGREIAGQEGREVDAPRLPPLEYIGQLLRGYLVAEAPGAVVLIDQHAAHERVLFDRIVRRP